MSLLNVASSFAVSVTRLGAGMKAAPSDQALAKEALVLFEFEGCPFCRKVREALTELDLDAEIRPCPKNGQRFRPQVTELGGKAQFPFLIDPNTGWEGYESAAIVDYLFRTYGKGKKPGFLIKGNAFATLNSSIASGIRPMNGMRAKSSRAPEQPLELYSFEISPFCRVVREKLCELETPYILHNVGKGSPSREAFIKRSGKMMVPYLIDPNTGVEMFESADIVKYLEDTYSL
ncbi:MAG: glutathione S-transferase N-terminal domain-containing protein [Pseudomonadales bacterium]|nr:glutathione S-transferase N-terminal domain-containing protein [Pseudomonadales bacterium]